MTFGAIQIVINAVDNFSKTFSKINTKLAKFKTAGLGAGLVGGAIAGGLALSLKQANKVETGFAKVNTLLDKGSDAQKTYGEFVKQANIKMANQGSQIDVLNGLYQTISAGITDTGDSQLFLNNAIQSAVGGSAELPKVIEAGTKTMAAFGLGAKDSAKVFDIFAGTVKAGQTNMSQLASSFPTFAGTAGSLGVNIEETAGTFAALTKVMASPEEAATALNAVFTGLIKPSDAMRKTLKDMGFESGQAAIKQLGLVGTLKKLSNSTGGSTEKMGKLFGNVRALRAIFPLMGKASKDLAASIDIVSNSQGLAKKQAEDIHNTFKNQLGESMSKVQNLSTDFGKTLQDVLVPILSKLNDVLTFLLDSWNNLSPGMKQAIVIFTAVTAVVFLAAGAIALLTAVSSPWLLILLVIAAAITVIILIMKNWGKIMNFITKVMIKTGLILSNTWDSIVTTIKELWVGMKIAFVNVWNSILSILDKAINQVVLGMNPLLKAIEFITGKKFQINFKSLKIDTKGLTSELDKIKQGNIIRTKLRTDLADAQIKKLNEQAANKNIETQAVNNNKKATTNNINIQNLYGTDPAALDSAFQKVLGNKV